MDASGWELSTSELGFYRTFGYLHLPGLLADEIDRIDRAFEAVLADPTVERWSTEDAHGPLVACRANHDYLPRTSIPSILERHPDLAWLADDERLRAAATSVLGSAERRGSIGDVMSCPTMWHVDIWGAPLAQDHLKVFLYLDPLDAESGALRVMPGSHTADSPVHLAFRRLTLHPEETVERLGVEATQLPAQVIPTLPGDVILLDYRTVHASFHGGPRRRLIGIDFRQTAPV